MFKKKNLFENVEISSVEYARTIVEKSTAQLNRVKIGLIIEAFATLMSVIGYMNDGTKLGFTLLSVGFVSAMASYIVGGGFMTAVSWAVKVGKIGWMIMPFPIDIATGVCAVFLSFIVFFFLPVIFVLLNFVQIKKDYDFATDYLANVQATNA